MQNRLILGMTCLMALVACRLNIPHPSTQTSSASNATGNTSKTTASNKPPVTRERIAPAMSPTGLKYRVLERFPNQFFCDPDAYPVASADEAELARKYLPELQANQEEFQAILTHTGLSGLRPFSDEQTLLIYREHKRLRAIYFEPVGDRYQFQLQIIEGKQQGFVVKGVVDRNGSVTVQERESSIVDCPICLAAQTQIDTPKGSVTVTDLRVGDIVWTADESGVRLAATIEKTVRVPAPSNHRTVHIVLEDGRELWVSPGHPTTDEHTIADLRTGDFLNGGRIVRLEEEAYRQPATYDILPSGRTGYYWANGILIGSTLAEVR
jgi:hypothetical protein